MTRLDASLAPAIHIRQLPGTGPGSQSSREREVVSVIRNLKLEGYRSFESYELQDLTRVNLLVGRNNCGKTSILEAVQFLVSGGTPSVLGQIAGERSEVYQYESPDNRYSVRSGRVADISHFIFGRHFGPKARFAVMADEGGRWVRMEVEEDQDDLHSDQRPLFDKDADDAQPLVVRITSSRIKDAIVIPADANGSLFLSRKVFGTIRRSVLSHTPALFVTAASLDVDRMSHMWRDLVLEGREQEVINALKLVEPNLQSVHFLSGNGHGSNPIVLGHQGRTRRTPIGSHGDGTRRLLALALSLTDLSGGVLLFDEIDTGFHWTVLEDVWKLVVQHASAANIQVFATTHSYDCICGLASFVASNPELAAEVSVYKVERALERAVRFDGAAVERAVNSGIELR